MIGRAGAACPRSTAPGNAGEVEAVDAEAGGPCHFHVDHRHRDRNAGAPLEHFVEAAVARVLVPACGCRRSRAVEQVLSSACTHAVAAVLPVPSACCSMLRRAASPIASSIASRARGRDADIDARDHQRGLREAAARRVRSRGDGVDEVACASVHRLSRRAPAHSRSSASSVSSLRPPTTSSAPVARRPGSCWSPLHSEPGSACRFESPARVLDRHAPARVERRAGGFLRGARTPAGRAPAMAAFRRVARRDDGTEQSGDPRGGNHLVDLVPQRAGGDRDRHRAGRRSHEVDGAGEQPSRSRASPGACAPCASPARPRARRPSARRGLRRRPGTCRRRRSRGNATSTPSGESSSPSSASVCWKARKWSGSLSAITPSKSKMIACRAEVTSREPFRRRESPASRGSRRRKGAVVGFVVGAGRVVRHAKSMV